MMTIGREDVALAIAVVAGGFCAWVLLRIALLATSWLGRRRIMAAWSRTCRYEFWPPRVFYAPLVIWMVLLSIRHRGMLVFTCVNPGISHGGGTLGESKCEILAGFTGADGRMLPCMPIEPGDPDARADELDRLVRTNADLGGYPVICKPDSAQRGHAVKVIGDRDAAAAYFARMPRRAIVQALHTGPHECGILWARHEGSPVSGRTGRVISVTHKVFQYAEGDGERTLRELIYADARLRCQAKVFLRRFAPDASRVLARGERLRLSMTGNHAQGTMFKDGRHLLTPELEEIIDELCASYSGVGGGALDFGRFDLRYASAEALGRGEFGIVEFNGAMAESTNIYDPSWSVWRAYAALFRQWALLYRLGAMRRREGVWPLRIMTLVRTARRHYAGRRDAPVSD